MPLKLIEKSVDIPLDAIEQSHQKWRTTTGDRGIEELAESIKRNGQIHNISLLKTGKGKYEVINGHRRFGAGEFGGFPTLRADLYEFEPDDGEQLDLAIARHLYAANLSEPLLPLERARMFNEVMHETGFDIAQVADLFDDESTESVGEALALLGISDEALEVIEKNADRFTEGHLRVLADYAGTGKRAWRMQPAEQARVAREIVEQKDKVAVRDPRKFETRIKAVVNERRQQEKAKNQEETKRRQQSDPVKTLFRALEKVEAGVAELYEVDLAQIKAIDAADKGYVLNKAYTVVEQLTTLADESLGKLPVRKAEAAA
jgi:ParB/RepB/Spo0J family partition protein